MWGKRREAQISEFFKGTNIFHRLNESMFGKIKHTFEDIFTQQDIDQYKLPKIVVIGSESAGKSSLLENITKCQLFPRDGKLCTKNPINVKLTKGESKYVIQFPQDKDNDQYNVIEVKNKNEIYGMVNEYMKKLPPDHISESEILIEITDHDVPNFQFFDLPGIRTYPQISCDMTTKLCKKYLSDKNTIVLCVVPATTSRLTSCQSIALISEMGMQHNCILALTMADKLQSDDIEELLIKRIVRTSDELNGLDFAGYIAVVNRTHPDSHSLEENDIQEIKWFEENILQEIPDDYKQYKQLIQDNITITNLVTRMDELYNDFIHRDWQPRILAMITTKITDLQLKYNAMGDEFIESNKLNFVISDFVNSMYEDVRKSCDTTMVSFNELFENKDETQDQNVNEDDEYDRDDRYHESMKLINDNIQNYSNFEISYIKQRIEEFFESEQDHKINRFLNIKNDLLDKMTINFDRLKKENIKKIRKSVEKYMISNYLINNSVNSSHYNEVFKLYKLLILHPLLKTTFNYNTEDYIESDDYKQKRKDLLESIANARSHYEIIDALPCIGHEGHKKVCDLKSLKSKEESLNLMESVEPMKSLESVASLESLESMKSLESLEPLEPLESLEHVAPLKEIEPFDLKAMESFNSENNNHESYTKIQTHYDLKLEQENQIHTKIQKCIEIPQFHEKAHSRTRTKKTHPIKTPKIS